jgi:hypothetical protein
LLQSAYFRPHNRSEEFDNLYFVGAGTHPGAGVPSVLSSGKIASELIDPGDFLYERNRKQILGQEPIDHLSSDLVS